MLAFGRAPGTRAHVLAATLAGKPLFWLAFIVVMFTWPILRSIQAEHDLPRSRPVLGRVRDFTLHDQHGADLGSAELRGRIWVASVFDIEQQPPGTRAQRTMLKMAEVRHRTRNLGDTIRLVTFTRSSADEAAAEAVRLSATYRANHGTWRFVSGPPDRVRDILLDLRLADSPSRAACALVDGDMQIRGYYDLADETAVDRLMRDVSLLLSPAQ